MSQKPRSIEQQISHLKSRGMSFPDEAQAKKSLAGMSYFRLKYYWKDLIEDDETGDFRDGATFTQVLRRHDFDHRLRQILFEAIGIVEVALRAKIISLLSQMTDGGLWYLDGQLFENKTFHEDFVLDLKYEFQRSTEPFVKQFLAEHPDFDADSFAGPNPDAWQIIEVANLGTLSKMYKNLRNQLPARAAIANGFGLYSARDLSNWIEVISLIRNVVAHHGRLWNRSFGKKILDTRSHRDPWLTSPLTENQRKKPYAVAAALAYLCNAVQPGNPITRNLRHLLADFPDLPLQQIGFPKNWQDEPLWK